MIENRTIELYVDGAKTDEILFLANERTIYLSPLISPVEDKVTVILVSDVDCTTPSKMPDGWDDSRCLSVQFTNISIELFDLSE